MRELYVYWKAPRTAAVTSELNAALAELMQRHPGLQARLLRRADDGSSEALTWMEVYTAPGAIINAVLVAEIEAVLAPRLARFGAGPRHIEVFEPAR
jgi:hypothetical protein